MGRLRLRTIVGEHLDGPALAELSWLYCDRCGHGIDPRQASGEELAQWGSGPEGDLCPTCDGSIRPVP
jgi:hypothetical protein